MQSKSENWFFISYQCPRWPTATSEDTILRISATPSVAHHYFRLMIPNHDTRISSRQGKTHVKAKSGPFQRQTRSIPTRLPAPARKSPRSTPPCLVACPNAPSKQGLRSIVLTVTLLSDNLYSLFWLEISVIILGKDLLQHSCCNLQDPPFRVIMDNYGCL